MILSDVAYVAWREVVKFFRAKTRPLVTVIQPLIWLGLMGNMMQGLTQSPFIEKLLGTGSYLAFMTPGIIVMTVLSGGVFAGMSIVWDRRIGYLEKLLAAPISRAAIPLGKMVAAAVQGRILGPSHPPYRRRFGRAVRHRNSWGDLRPLCGHGL